VGKEFEYILDECIAHIRSGEADVDSCLNKYPKYASQLRPLLEIAVLLYREPQPQPRPEAVSRGEQILLQKVAGKRSGKAVDKGLTAGIGTNLSVAKKVIRGAWVPSMRWRLRWVGIVAGIIAFTLIGYGVFAASNHSLPGDFLYPLKTARERIQLILTTSEEEKGEFHIILAERRMQEITELSRSGRGDEVAELIPIVGKHLEEVRQALVSTGDPRDSEELKTKLEDSAGRGLTELEGALREANDDIRPMLSEALQVSGESYGTVIEDAIASTPLAAVIGDMGTIQVIITDPPPPEEIDSAVVDVETIEVHLAAGPDSRWIVIISEPPSFDLMELIEGKEMNIGNQKVDTGIYTQVRMNIAGATVTVDGIEHEVSIPSGTLKLVRPFRVKRDETTMIILDFDGKGSIHVTGSGEYMLKPVVNLFISEQQGE
jgi:hypothetical protein